MVAQEGSTQCMTPVLCPYFVDSSYTTSQNKCFHSLCCRPMLFTGDMLLFLPYLFRNSAENHSDYTCQILTLCHHWSSQSSLYVVSFILFSYLPLSIDVCSVIPLSAIGPSVIHTLYVLSIT